MNSHHHEAIGVVATVCFSAFSWVANSFDWSYADSVFIAPLQHGISIISGIIAIIIGAPLAWKKLTELYQFMKTIFKKP